MKDNVRSIRPQAPDTPTALELATALDASIGVTDRLAAELGRLGNGVIDLRDEWSATDSLEPQAAARRLHALLIGRSL